MAYSAIRSSGTHTEYVTDASPDTVIDASAGDMAYDSNGKVWVCTGGTNWTDCTGGATPSAHAGSHEDTGSDEINVVGLSGELADAQPPKAHLLGGAGHTADVLANLNAKVSDATLGILSKVFCDTYEGDDSNDRVLDLGDDYDFVVVSLEESKTIGVSHLGMAYAVRTTYGLFYEDSVSGATRHRSMALTDLLWQGKMAGADANKIKLGSDGSSDQGTNNSGWTYRILAFKFGAVETF